MSDTPFEEAIQRAESVHFTEKSRYRTRMLRAGSRSRLELARRVGP